MERRGFIQDMMDVKVLVLYVAARVDVPVTVQEIYELCFQDDKLTYFDICTVVPDLVRTGHLLEEADGTYRITEKGRTNGEATADSVAYSVRERVRLAVERFNRQSKRRHLIRTRFIPTPEGNCIAHMELDDATGRLMTLELTAPNQPQAAVLCRTFQERAEYIYSAIITDMLEDEAVCE